MSEVQMIRTYLRRYTFQSDKIKHWVEENCEGKVLNLFAGKTNLDVDETRVDIDEDMNADVHKDAVDYVKGCDEEYDTVICDPPYSYRKSMEMYDGNYCSRFKVLADEIPSILRDDGKVISFGYHSSFLGEKRGFPLQRLCVFAHGGAQHCTIAIIESEEVE